MSDEKPMGQVIQIDEARIRDHEALWGTRVSPSTVSNLNKKILRQDRSLAEPAHRRRASVSLSRWHLGSNVGEALGRQSKPDAGLSQFVAKRHPGPILSVGAHTRSSVKFWAGAARATPKQLSSPQPSPSNYCGCSLRGVRCSPLPKTASLS